MTELLAAILLVSLGAGPELNLETLEGRSHAGTLAQLDAEQLSLETPDGPLVLPLDQVRRLTPARQPQPASAEPRVWIALADGSRICAREFTSRAGKARIELLDGQTAEVSLAQVKHVRLQAADAAAQQEWHRLLDKQFDSDVLVIRKGEAVNYFPGVLHEVGSDTLSFELEGERMPVARSKVFGLIYHHAGEPGGEEPRAMLADRSGSQWAVGRLELKGQSLRVTTPAGVEIAVPLEALRWLDLSVGKVQYLSDLEPASVEWTPFFGSGGEIPVLDRFFQPRKDTNLSGRPLRLQGTEYRKGLCLHSRTEMIFRLPGEFRWFEAVAGIDDAVRPQGHVRLVIHGDGRVLFDEQLGGRDQPRRIRLDIAGVRRLGILVDFGEDLDVADHLDLCEARVIK